MHHNNYIAMFQLVPAIGSGVNVRPDCALRTKYKEGAKDSCRVR